MMLFEHYGIDRTAPAAFPLLALQLARDFIPGMRIVEFSARKRGRPKKWKGVDGVLLVKSVQRINAERKKGVADAVRIARNRKPEWSRYNSDTLESRYYEALELIKKDKSLSKLFDLLRGASVDQQSRKFDADFS